MLNQLLQPSYWFTFNPALVGGVSGTIIFVFFVLLFLLGILTKFMAPSRITDRFLLSAVSQATTLLITMGLLGVILYFFSFERIRFFGARFWYPLWLIATIGWGYWVVRYMKLDVPSRRQQSVEQKEKQKYFPPRRK